MQVTVVVPTATGAPGGGVQVTVGAGSTMSAALGGV
jgi:hypothetical protein